jgi:hypothetical protein
MSTYEQISHTQDATSRGPSLDINDLNTNNNVPTTPTNAKGYSKVSILQPRKKTKKHEETCAICLGTVAKKNSSVTPCGHHFCLTCLHTHLTTSHLCPCCRGRILDKKPEKPLVKITKNTSISIIDRELRDWDMSQIIENLNAFKRNSRQRLMCDFQSFGLEIVKQLIAYQINGDEPHYTDRIYSSDQDGSGEEDSDIEEFSEEDEPEPVFVRARQRQDELEEGEIIEEPSITIDRNPTPITAIAIDRSLDILNQTELPDTVTVRHNNRRVIRDSSDEEEL